MKEDVKEARVWPAQGEKTRRTLISYVRIAIPGTEQAHRV